LYFYAAKASNNTSIKLRKQPSLSHQNPINKCYLS
jgi:hypothetical protein